MPVNAGLRFEVLVLAFLLKLIQACTNKLRTEPVYKCPQTWLLLSSESSLHSQACLSTYMIVCFIVCCWSEGAFLSGLHLTCVYMCTSLREHWLLLISAPEQGVCVNYVPCTCTYNIVSTTGTLCCMLR